MSKQQMDTATTAIWLLPNYNNILTHIRITMATTVTTLVTVTTIIGVTIVTKTTTITDMEGTETTTMEEIVTTMAEKTGTITTNEETTIMGETTETITEIIKDRVDITIIRVATTITTTQLMEE